MKSTLRKYANADFEQINSDMLEKIYFEQLNEQDRKKMGQIYTPRYIIQFILHHIDLLINLKDIPISLDLKILDPACGLGRFLLEAYDFLKKKLQESNWDDQYIHDALLTQFLYGIDIDPLAVEFTAMALYLKKKTQPVDYLFITQSNILKIEQNAQTQPIPVKMRKFHIIEQKKGKKVIDKILFLKDFDVIIGNPPYFLISQESGRSTKGKQFHTTYIPKNLIDIYQANYKSWPKNGQDQNIFYLFIERNIQLLRDGGYLGFIIPDILLSGETTESLRKFILETCCIKKIILIEGQVFAERGISTIIIVLQRCNEAKLREKNKIKIIETSTLELIERDSEGKYHEFDELPHYIPQAVFHATPQKNFAIRMTEANIPIFQNIFEKIKEKVLIRFGNVLEIQRGIENLKKQDAYSLDNNLKKTHRKLIAATNIEKYRINWDTTRFSHKFVDYDPQNPANKHINFKKREWFEQKKIVLKRVSNKLVAALDEGQENDQDYFFTMDSIQMIWLKDNTNHKYDLRVILAILNSDFMNFYYQILFSYKKLFSRVQKAFLQELPLPPKILEEKQEKICNLVNHLMKSFDLKTEESLNQLIYTLYFTQEELNQFKGLFHTPPNLKNLPGIGIRKLWELKKLGIKTLNDLLKCDSEKVANTIKGIGTKSVEKWKIEAEILLKKF